MVSLRQRLCLLLSGTAALAAAFALPPAASAQKPVIQLFNGKDLTNFYTWLVGDHRQDPDHVFTVVDAVDGAPAIRVSGQKFGAFITEREFSDYHLVTEYRWGPSTWGSRKDRTRDSGILLHCQGPDGNTAADFNGPWMLSQECQIIEGGVGDFILVAGHNAQKQRIVPTLTVQASKDVDGEDIYDPNAPPKQFAGGRINWFGRDPSWADVIGYRGGQDVESPYPYWTRLEVICDGGSITNIVNGVVVNKGTDSSLRSGKIIFQSEGAEIFFRKIDLTPLR